MKVLDDPNVSGRNDEMNALLAALTALRKGDATVRLPSYWIGSAGQDRRGLQRRGRAERRPGR